MKETERTKKETQELQERMLLAMFGEDLSEIESCLKAGADINHQLTNKELVREINGVHYGLGAEGESWLSMSCRAPSRQDRVDLLLHYGANPNQVDAHVRDQYSIVMNACSAQDKQSVVKSLVRAGADVFYQNQHGDSLLDVLIYHGTYSYLEIIEEIHPNFMPECLEKTKGKEFLILEVIQNLGYDFLDKIEQHPEYWEHVNQCNLKGETALISHAQYLKKFWNYVNPPTREQYKKVFEQLLKMGADPSIKDKMGVSAKDIIAASHAEGLVHLMEWHELNGVIPKRKEALKAEPKAQYVKRL